MFEDLIGSSTFDRDDPISIINELNRRAATMQAPDVLAQQQTQQQQAPIPPQMIIDRLNRKMMDEHFSTPVPPVEQRQRRPQADTKTQPGFNTSDYGEPADSVTPKFNTSDYGELATPPTEETQQQPAADQAEWGGYPSVIGRGLAAGAVETTGATLKGLAALAAKQASYKPYYDAYANWDQLSPDQQAAVIKKVQFDTSLPNVDRVFLQQQFMLRGQGEKPKGLGELAPAVKDTGLYHAGEAVEQFGKKQFPLSEVEADSITGRTAKGVGAGATGVGLMLGATALGGPAVGIGVGAAQMGAAAAGGTFDEAMQKGATEEQAAKAAGLNALASGALGTLPLGTILAPARYLAPGLMGQLASRLEHAVVTGTAFATIGEAQEYLARVIAKEFYDPKSEYKDDWKRVIASFLAGGIIGGVTAKVPTEVDDFIRKVRENDPAATATYAGPPGRGAAQREEIDEFLRARAEREARERGEGGPPKGLPGPETGAPTGGETEPGPKRGPTGGAARADEDAILRRAGYDDETIAVMDPAQRAGELEEARERAADEKISRMGREPTAEAAKPVEEAAPKEGTRAAPVEVKTGEDVTKAAAVASQDHSPAQDEAGNRQLGHAKWNGLDISIEAPANGVRKRTAADGTEVETRNGPAPYGYFKGIPVGADGQHPDVYVGPNPERNLPAVVIDEIDPKTGKYRQSKSFVGFPSQGAAVRAYLGTSTKTKAMIGGMRVMQPNELVELAKSGGLARPVSEEMKTRGVSEKTPEKMSTAEFQAAARRGVIGPAEPAVNPNFERINRPPVEPRGDGRRDLIHQHDIGLNYGYHPDDVARYVAHRWAIDNDRAYQKKLERAVRSGAERPTTTDEHAAAAHRQLQAEAKKYGKPQPASQATLRDIAETKRTSGHPVIDVETIAEDNAIRRSEERSIADHEAKVHAELAAADVKPGEVRPADIDRAAEIAANEERPTDDAIQIGIIRSALEDGYAGTDPDKALALVRKMYGPEISAAVESKLSPEFWSRAPASKSSPGRTPTEEPAEGVLRGGKTGAEGRRPEREADEGTKGGEVPAAETAGGRGVEPERAGAEAAGPVARPERGEHAGGGERPAELAAAGSAGERTGATGADTAAVSEGAGERGREPAKPTEAAKDLKPLERLKKAYDELTAQMGRRPERPGAVNVAKLLKAADVTPEEYHHLAQHIDDAVRITESGHELKMADSTGSKEPGQKVTVKRDELGNTSTYSQAYFEPVRGEPKTKEPLERIPGAGVLEVQIHQNADGKRFNVVLRDTEANQTVGFGPIVDTLERARAEAKKMLKGPEKPAATEKWTEIGKNADGVTLFEDADGVRSYLRGNVRITEPVQMRPTREGVKASVKRPAEGEWALAAEGPEKPAEEQTLDALRDALKPEKKPAAERPTSDVSRETPVKEVAKSRENELVMDKPISEQSDFVRKALENHLNRYEVRSSLRGGTATGREFLDRLQKLMEARGEPHPEVEALKLLKEVGVTVGRPEPAPAGDLTLDQIKKHFGEHLKLLREVPNFPRPLAAYVHGFNDYRAGTSGRVFKSPDEGAAHDRGGEDAMRALREVSDGVPSTVPAGDEGAGPRDVQATEPVGQAGSVRGSEVEGGRPAVSAVDEVSTEGARGVSKAALGEGSRGASEGATDRVPAEFGQQSKPGREKSAAERDAAAVKGENYSIAPGALAESRGWAQKARDNVRAIELVRQIEAEGRPATREEQDALARYVGWGGIKGAFPDESGAFAKGLEKTGERIKELLTPAEYTTARRSIQYAHYTSEPVVRAMWKIAQRLGFEGGQVFEPGMGIGNFAGMMPPDLAARTRYTGLELDHTTARIAKLLYPKWGVRQGDFTRAPLPDNTFDMAIGNPPFADIVIKSDPRYAKDGLFLHDYFFAKSLDGVRPGGIVAFISSAGTMNKASDTARSYIADRADLVGAIRLPSMAFRQNAGTDVTTDIIVLRKRAPGDPEGDRSWTEVAPVELPNKEGKLERGYNNRYFIDHPEMVLGDQGWFDKLYEGRYAVHAPEGFDLARALDEAVERFPRNVMKPWESPGERAEVDFGTSEKKEGTFYLGPKGELHQVREGVGVPVQRRGSGVEGGRTAAEIERIHGLIPIRDALRAVFEADMKGDAENGGIARARLNRDYDAFVKKFGPINKADLQRRRPSAVQSEGDRSEAREEARYAGVRFDEGTFDPSDLVARGASLAEIARARKAAKQDTLAKGRPWSEGAFDPDEQPDVIIDKRPNVDAFMADPESYRLRAIEHYDDASNRASKSLVFHENILTKEREPEIKSTNDAVLHVLNQTGHLDIPEIARLIGKSDSQVIEELGERIFKLPGTTDQWVSRDEYLSGDVKDKIAIAREQAERNPEFRRNVTALEAAQPVPRPPSQIGVKLGSPWIPTKTVEEFGLKVLGLDSIKVTYIPKLAQWVVSGDKDSVAATATWGTSDRSAPELVNDALNQKDPKIYDYVDKKQVLNLEKTQAAQDKVTAIRERFNDWVWEDQERSDYLAGLYNENHNRLVAREYNGDYLTTPGVAATWKWRPHQTRVVARIIQAGNTYMAHAVGAGKTSAMIGAGMEMRRLGLVRKPMYAVPNHMLGQFTKEFYEQYPTARLAIADEQRFHTDRRKQFVANIASEDLDGIIITHSAFGRIPISDEFQDRMIQQELEEYREILSQLGGPENRIPRGRIEKQIERLEQRLVGRGGKNKDQVFTFEQTGIDFLFIDEAHLFRKLDFATNMGNIKGISSEGSNASWDLYVKTRHLAEQRPGRSLVLASGTPITNTMAELFSLSRYLQSGELARRGLDRFDSWAGMYGETRTDLEQNASGGYDPVTRFRKFVNAADLSVMVRQVMDVVTSRQLEQYVVRPKLKGGSRIMNMVEPSAALTRYQNELGQRMAAIRARKGPPKKGDDIMLSVINDGRHAAIDMRLIDPDAAVRESKLTKLVDNVHRIWKETRRQPFHSVVDGQYSERPTDRGPATQMVFVNLGLSGARGFAVPDYIRAELMRRGVPKSEIAYIYDYKNHVARQRLFNDMNEGKVRVLIGSTAKMATGVNAQRRLYAVHNEDPLWYPADDEQRNGRALRQGNMNPEIEIHDYSTKGTYDSSMWKLMANKAGFIRDFFEGDHSLVEMEDLGEASQYEQAAAMTTSDPRVMVLTEMKHDLQRSIRRKDAFENEQYALRRNRSHAVNDLQNFNTRIASLEKDVAQRVDTAGDKFSGKVGSKSYATRADFGAALNDLADKRAIPDNVGKNVAIGEVGGFPVFARTGVIQYATRPDSYATELTLRTNDGYALAIGGHSDLGLVASAEGRLRNFESDIDYYKEKATKTQKFLDDSKDKVGLEFTGDEAIAELKSKINALEAELKAPPTVAVPVETNPATIGSLDQLRFHSGRFDLPTEMERPQALGRTRFEPLRADRMEGLAEDTTPLLAPLDEARRGRLEQAMTTAVQHLVGPNIRVAFQDTLPAVGEGWGGDKTAKETKTAGGAYVPAENLIELALRPSRTPYMHSLTHEAWHAIEDHFLDHREMAVMHREMPALRAMAARVFKVPVEDLRNIADHEIRAVAFEAYTQDRISGGTGTGSGLHIGIRRAFERIMNMLQRIGNMLRGMGFQTYKDVFGKAYEGKMAERPSRKTQGWGSRMEETLKAQEERLGGFDEAGAVKGKHTMTPETVDAELTNRGWRKSQEMLQGLMEPTRSYKNEKFPDYTIVVSWDPRTKETSARVMERKPSNDFEGDTDYTHQYTAVVEGAGQKIEQLRRHLNRIEGVQNESWAKFRDQQRLRGPAEEGERSHEPSSAELRHRDLGPFPADTIRPLGEQAQRYVLDRGRATGLEHMVAFDANGAAITHGSGSVNNTGMPARLETALRDPSQRIVVHHNHPSNRGLSTADVAYLGTPGMEAVWAHGHGGLISRASLTPQASLRLPRDTDARIKMIWDISKAADNNLIPWMWNAIQRGAVTRDEANAAHGALINTILHRAGLINYTSNFDADAYIAKSGLAPQVADITSGIKGIIYGDREAPAHDRRAWPLRHIGDLGAAFEGHGEPAGGRAVEVATGGARPADRGQEAPGRRVAARDEDTAGGFASGRPKPYPPPLTPLQRANQTIVDRITGLFQTQRGISVIENLSNLSHRVKLLERDLESRRRGWIADRSNSGEPILPENLPDEQQFYTLKRLFPGKVGNEVGIFNKAHLDPLVKHMRDNGISLQDGDEYLYAKHAEERNVAMGRYYADQPDHQFFKAMRDPDVIGGSGMSAREARNTVHSFETGPKGNAYRELSRRIREISAFNLNMMERYGLERRETLDAWRKQYKDYVPLRGWEDLPEEAPPENRKGGQFNVRGPEVKRAFGRSSRADSPIAHMIDQVYRTIDRGEKNAYLRSLARALMSIPAELRSDIALVNRGRPKREIDPATGLVRVVDDHGDRFRPEAVSFKDNNGNQNFMVFHDVRLAEAVKRMTPTSLFPTLLNLQNKIKALYTHWSPDFMVRHFIFRYPIEGFLNAQELRESGRFSSSKYIRDAFPVMGAATKAIFARERGEAAGKLGEYWDEMKAGGGAMTFRSMRDVDLLREHLNSVLRDLKGKPHLSFGQKFRKMVEAMDHITNTMDNSLRLAAYAQARDQGMSPQKAALTARDATIDYQFRAKLSNVIGLFFQFYNTAMRTGTRMAGALGRSKVMRKVALGVVGMSVLAGLWNYLVGGDDKEDGKPFFEKIAPWDRELNFVIMNPFDRDEKGRPLPIRIPMPYNYAFFTNLGHILAGMMAPSSKETMGERLHSLTKSFLSAFTPLGEGGNMMDWFTPELLKPLAHIAENRAWTGAPLHIDPLFQKGPASWSGRNPTGGYERTGEGWKQIAETVNKFSGGSQIKSGLLDFYPEDYREIFDHFFGAQKRTVAGAIHSGAAVAEGKAPKSTDIPLLRVFRGADYDAADRAAMAKQKFDAKHPWLRHDEPSATPIPTEQWRAPKPDPKVYDKSGWYRPATSP